MKLDEWADQGGRAAFEQFSNGLPLVPWDQLKEDIRERWRGVARAVLGEGKIEFRHDHLADYRSAQGQLEALREALKLGEASDGYHTHNELYTYRMLYNALAALAFKAVGWLTVKSWYHSDGKRCFDSPDWFVVHMDTPAGQITNHYKREYWRHFEGIETVARAPEWDGHSPEVAAMRLEASIEFLRQAFDD